MARLGSSIDIGEDLEKEKSKSCSLPSAKPAQHRLDQEKPSKDEDSKCPNVVMGWKKAVQRPQSNDQPVSRYILWSALLLIFVILIAYHNFSATQDFPGIDSAMEKQMKDALTVEVSHRIAEDYRSVSEARKRYMFNEKFDSLVKSAEFKSLVKQKQGSAKDMFKDQYGMPYLYTPESYRYAELAREGLGLGSRLKRTGHSSEDEQVSAAIASFYTLSSFLRPSDSVEWSAFYLPVFLGILLTVFVCFTATSLSKEPLALLFAGISLAVHPFIASGFSAGLPHPSVIFLVSAWVILFVISIAGSFKDWRAAVPILLALLMFAWLPAGVRPWLGLVCIFCAGIMLISERRSWNASCIGTVMAVLALIGIIASTSISYASIALQISMIGKGVSLLTAVSLILSVWMYSKRNPESPAMAAASALFIGSLLISPEDQSHLMAVASACVLVGIGASVVVRSLAGHFAEKGSAKNNMLIRVSFILLAAAVIAVASYSAAGSANMIVLPGIDDSLYNVSTALRLDANPDAVFISDPVTADPVAFLSSRSPALSNQSSPAELSMFTKAMLSTDENESRELISVLSCNSSVCPSQRYLVITDRLLQWLSGYALESGIDVKGQKTTMPSSCDIKPEGGIACTNGFEILDLNATIKGEFPARMVSFIGNKRIVNYDRHKVEESFVIYRENGMLFSFIVPSQLDSSLLVRALGHDNVTFLEEVSSSSTPTHSAVYRIK